MKRQFLILAMIAASALPLAGNAQQTDPQEVTEYASCAVFGTGTGRVYEFLCVGMPFGEALGAFLIRHPDLETGAIAEYEKYDRAITHMPGYWVTFNPRPKGCTDQDKK